ETYAQIFAYLLRANGVQPGDRQLPYDTRALASMLIPRTGEPAPAVRGKPTGPSGGISPYATLPPAPERPSPLDGITPVTDETLKNPPAQDWLTWRRTYDAHGFSPLKQINRSNVGELRLAWSWSLPTGPNEGTPLVHDGVMFVHGYGDHVQA